MAIDMTWEKSYWLMSAEPMSAHITQAAPAGDAAIGSTLFATGHQLGWVTHTITSALALMS
jgi:hypothetical protein